MARSFNGTTDVIDCGSGAGSFAPGTKSLTAACWVRFTSTGATEGLVTRWNSPGGIFQFELVLDSTVMAMVVSGGGLVDGATTISTATWYHTAGTYDGTNVKIWLNGAQDGSSAASSIVDAGTTSLVLGARGQSGGYDSRLNGRIADAALWSVPLTAAEIASLAKGARPWQVRPSSLQGFWPLDGLTSPEPDLSGLKNNGTLTGTSLAFGPPFMAFTPRWPMGGIFPFPPPPVFVLMPQIIM
jgi:hypothetical protein